jgi:hypothetical protein
VSVKERLMTVAMSECEYRVLTEAVAWIEMHAGKDAPECPQMARVSEVVNNIARRREPDGSKQWRPARPVDRLINKLVRATRLTDTYEVEETGAGPMGLRCRRCGRSWTITSERSWRCPDESDHDKPAIAALEGFVHSCVSDGRKSPT